MLLRIRAGAGRVDEHKVVFRTVPELWRSFDYVQRSVGSVEGVGCVGAGDRQREFYFMGVDVNAERYKRRGRGVADPEQAERRLRSGPREVERVQTHRVEDPREYKGRGRILRAGALRFGAGRTVRNTQRVDV